MLISFKDDIDYELEVNIYFDNAFLHLDSSPKDQNQYSQYDPGKINFAQKNSIPSSYNYND